MRDPTTKPKKRHALFGSSPARAAAAAGQGGHVYYFNGSGWTANSPKEWPASAEWNSDHTTHDIHATENEVHLVGDAVSPKSPGCRRGFYLHGTSVGDTWVFDRLAGFGDAMSDCGTAPFDHLSLRGITID